MLLIYLFNSKNPLYQFILDTPQLLLNTIIIYLYYNFDSIIINLQTVMKIVYSLNYTKYTIALNIDEKYKIIDIKLINDPKFQLKIKEKYRPIFAKELSKYKIRQVKNNQGVIFWGGKDINLKALHSEPKIDQHRLFISILPGTKEMIIERENNVKQFNKLLSVEKFCYDIYYKNKNCSKNIYL